MENNLKRRKFFSILLLIVSAGFFVLPNISLADEFGDITLREAGKHLELPENKVQEMIRSLINIFHSEWIDLVSSGYFSAEEMAVPNIMKKAVQVQALNHLLIDAPVEITWKIIKNGLEITKIILAQDSTKKTKSSFLADIGGLVAELEKQSVKKAVEYGMNALFQNEIRISPGAIGFEYNLKEGGTGKALIQYIMIYKPFDAKSGEMIVRFYSPNSLKPPKNESSIAMTKGMYTELEHDLSPFIVDIRGIVKDYKWFGKPSIDIDFPASVPDLGIKPLSFWERHILKPIETTIKEVEIIITKVTGKSLGLTDIWNKVKTIISKITQFSPAGLLETPALENPLPTTNEIVNEVKPHSIKEEVAIKTEPEKKPQLILEEIQEEFDDISERIDILQQEPLLLGLAKQSKEEELIDVESEILKNEKETRKEEEKERVEETEESEEETPDSTKQPEQIAGKEITLCQKNREAVRNKVIFNEIAWMGAENSANDEWMELKNISGQKINLAGWQILDKENQIKVIFDISKNPAIAGFFDKGFLLLERMDDDSVANIAADLIYTGALDNTNEVLYLFDNDCQLQDEIIANSDWPAGDNTSKRTTERKTDLTWQTSQNSGGTPKNENSVGLPIYYTAPGTPAPGAPQSPPVAAPSYLKILINEIQISATNSEKEDFVELYNPNNEDIGLANWYLQRKTKNSVDFSSYAPKSLFLDKTIRAKDYFLIANASSTFLPGVTTTYPLTEDNTLVLKNPDSEIVDKIGWGAVQDYETATTSNPQAGQSIGRRWSTTTESYFDTNNNYQDFEIQTPTPKSQNQSLLPSPPTQSQAPIAQFIYTPAAPLTNQEIIFNAASSSDQDGTITSFIWDFGDSTSTSATTSQTTTIHSYLTAGNFLVNLTVVDNDNATGSATTTIVIAVPETPTWQVIINEIAWMGTSATNSGDEWIELFNNTTSTIDLTGWRLASVDGSPNIIFSTSSITASTYFLIERTDDNTISDIIADATTSFGYGLSNSGEKLELRNASNTLIDVVDCSLGWFTGTTTPAYISMERISSTSTATSTNWENNNLITRNGLDAAGNKISGTPKAQNSVSKYQTTISELPFDEFSEITLTFLGSPYIVGTNMYGSTLNIPAGKILNIEPGINLKFIAPNIFYYRPALEVNGTLKARGQESKQIVFSRYEESYGTKWTGIYFASTGQNSILEYVKIENAYGPISSSQNYNDYYVIKVENSKVGFKNLTLDNNNSVRGIWLVNSSSTIDSIQFSGFNESSIYYSCGIYIQGGSPLIQNSIFRLNSYGIKLENSAKPLIQGNVFEENEVPIYALDSSPLLSGNQTNNNNFNGVLVKGIISQDATWQADLVYVVDYYLEVASNTALTLNPGVVVKMKRGALTLYYEAYMVVSGSLIAEGAENQPIIFTSFSDDTVGGETNNNWGGPLPNPWDWREITFSSGSQGVLKWVALKYGGDNRTNHPEQQNNPLVIEGGANVSQENVVIENCVRP